jgi:Lipocalin-like domain
LVFGETQSWEAVVDDRVIGYPLGEKASGFMAYDPISFMSVNISAPNRARIPVDDPFEGDPTFLILDAKKDLSYCGPFSMMPEYELIHHLKLWPFENSAGTNQPHYFQLDRNTRTISTRLRVRECIGPTSTMERVCISHAPIPLMRIRES